MPAKIGASRSEHGAVTRAKRGQGHEDEGHPPASPPEGLPGRLPRGLFLLSVTVLVSSQVTDDIRLFFRPHVATRTLRSGWRAGYGPTALALLRPHPTAEPSAGHVSTAPGEGMPRGYSTRHHVGV